MRECFTYVGTARNAVTGQWETVTVTCKETIADLKAIITRLTDGASADSARNLHGRVLESREICGEFFLYELQHYDLDGNTRVTLETGICNLNPNHPVNNKHRTAKGIPAARDYRKVLSDLAAASPADTGETFPESMG